MILDTTVCDKEIEGSHSNTRKEESKAVDKLKIMNKI
jgi:hypothetical protein